eukprot:1688733-Pleurochrysis_carterae.AAC.1
MPHWKLCRSQLWINAFMPCAVDGKQFRRHKLPRVLFGISTTEKNHLENENMKRPVQNVHMAAKHGGAMHARLRCAVLRQLASFSVGRPPIRLARRAATYS